MAINKNFVIKNGVQVSTDLIIGDADNNKVGIGTTIPGYDLHVAIGRKSRGGIGATDLVVTGVSTVKDLLVTGFSGFSSDVSVTGIVSARSFGIGTTEVIDRGLRLSGIASLDAITINTIEQAIRVGPNSFTDLKVTGISTFIGIATFSTGIDIKSGVSTFSAPLRLGFAHTTDHAGVALGATVGFGTSAFFRDDAAIFMGSDSDLKIHHDGSNSRIQDVGTGDLIIQGSADIKLQSASAENYIVANDTGSVDVYFDNSKKLETTSGGLKVTGITTLTNRLHVQAGVSTFDADVRFGIGATVGFGTSAFFKDEASIFMGDADDFELFHDGTDSVIRNRTGDLKLLVNNTENGIIIKDNEGVEVYFDNSKKLESTSGGLSVTGITTFSDRINVVSGVSTFQDDAKLTFGAQTDLLIQHDGTDTEIYNKTGNLKIRANDLDIQDYTNGHSMITADQDGSVDLFYDNYNALQTTPQGINVSGVTTSNRLLISGISTFTGLVDANGGAHIDNLRLGIDADNDITTSSGNLTLDSTGGTVEVNDNLQVDGQTDLNGDINLGDATSETITATARFDSDLIPSTDGARDLGSSSLEWEDLHIDGTAHIDTLDVDETAFVTTKLTVGTGVTIQNNGAVSIAGVTTANSGVRVNADSSNSDPDSATNYFSAGASEDLKIYHNGGTNYIAARDGDIQIRSDTFQLVSDDTAGRAIYLDNSNSRLELGFDGNHDAHYTGSGIDFLNDVDIDDTTQSTSNTTGALKVDGGVGIAKNVNIGGNLDVDGTSNFGDDVTLVAAGSSTILFDASAHQIVFQDNIRAKFGTGSDLSVYHDGSHSYVENNTGTLYLRAKEGENSVVAFPDGGVNIAFDDNTKIQTTSGGISVTGIATISDRLQVTSGISTFYDTTQSTSATTGAVIINGGVGIAKNLNVGGNLTVTGTTTFNGGTITLGDAATDNVVFSADVDSNIIPDDDDSFDLGSSTKEWQDLFIDGTAHIDTLDVDESAFVTTTLTVGTGLTVHPHGTVAIAGITTIGGNLLAGGDILPDDDGARDLGSSSKEFQDLFIDGTANIDSLAADTAAIGDLTDNRVVIAGSSGELEDDANLTFDGSKLNVGSGVATVFVTTGNVAFAGIATVGGGVLVGGASTFSSNVVIDGTLTAKGNAITLEGATPRINLTDTNNDSDFEIGNTNGTLNLADSTNGANRLRINSSGTVTIPGNLDAEGGLDVTGAITQGSGDITLTATVGSGSSTILFDTSAGTVTFQDNLRAQFGTGGDLTLLHDGTNSQIRNNNDSGRLDIRSDTVHISDNDNSADMARFNFGGSVQLYHNYQERVTTTADGTDFGGTGSIRVPNGTTGERNSSPAAGDFRYNTTTGKFEGYTDEWGDIGGSGGVEETSTSVSTTSATSTGSFAIASFRSASIIAQITQGSNYQVGRYLVIHDGTNVTTIEESAVATGSMLGTFEGVINSSNLEFRVTMGSSSSATVKTKIDTVTV